MKPQCPTKCGRELGDGSFVLCPDCYSQIPQHMRDSITRAALIVRKSRRPMAVQAALKNQREVRTAAIQYVIDKRNNEKATA